MKHILNNASEATDKPWVTLDENGVHYSGNGATYEMVDLGLPSGLLWAAYNIGASKPEEYGDYFMWGSVTPNTEDECSWLITPYHSPMMMNSRGWQKYIPSGKESYGTVDNKTVLDPEDDAATQLLGKKYRIPTKDDFDELLQNTTNMWVENYNNSEVSGRLFVSKTDTTKSIFIPAAGWRQYSDVLSQKEMVVLWSSSLYPEQPQQAYSLGANQNLCMLTTYGRSDGNSIRPVSDK